MKKTPLKKYSLDVRKLVRYTPSINLLVKYVLTKVEENAEIHLGFIIKYNKKISKQTQREIYVYAQALNDCNFGAP